MIFHTRQKHVQPIKFSINQKEIDSVKSFNFLGMMLDENLTWKVHNLMVSNKLSKIIGILYRLKNIYPKQALMHIYNSLFLSHINYGLLLWGTELDKVTKLQKKTVRILTGSTYLAHSEPLFKSLQLLKVQDLYYLKLLKLYYNLSYGLLPSYFNCYLEVLNKTSPHSYQLRTGSRPLIRLPKIRLVLSESNVLYQLILLINDTHETFPTILQKINEKSHSFSGFSFNVTQIYIQQYSEVCSRIVCYQCGRS